MALYSIVYDTSSGAARRRAIAYPGFTDQTFTGGGTVFTLSYDIDAQHVVDVFIQGVRQEATAYTVDATANTVTMSEALNSQENVVVRVYLH